MGSTGQKGNQPLGYADGFKCFISAVQAPACRGGVFCA